MKFVILTNNFPPSVGGISTHSYYIAKYFVENKNSVHVITLVNNSNKNDDKYFKIWPILTKRLPRVDFILLWIVLLYIRPDWIHVCNAGLCNKFFAKKYKTITRVVGNDFLNPWIGYILPGRYFINRIPSKSLRLWVARKEKLRRQQLIRKGLAYCKIIITNSDWTRKKLYQFGVYNNNIYSLPGGVDVKEFKTNNNRKKLRQQYNIRPESFVLVTVSNLVPRKGHDCVIKAIARLKDEIPNILYIIVGDGYYKNELQKLVKRYQLESWIDFVGKIPHNQVKNYYQLSDIYIQMSRDSQLSDGFISNAETMGRTFLEASAAGIPVIATNIGGIPSVVKNGYNGLLIDEPENIDLIAEAILKLKIKSSRMRLGKNGIHMVHEKFSWTQIGKRMEGLMNRFAEGNT